jgi:ERCC4-type nuclease
MFDAFQAGAGKVATVTVNDVFFKQLATLPGVGPTKARGVLRHFPTVHDLMRSCRAKAREGLTADGIAAFLARLKCGADTDNASSTVGPLAAKTIAAAFAV